LKLRLQVHSDCVRRRTVAELPHSDVVRRRTTSYARLNEPLATDVVPRKVQCSADWNQTTKCLKTKVTDVRRDGETF
jgi:hypothetical protein